MVIFARIFLTQNISIYSTLQFKQVKRKELFVVFHYIDE